MNSGQLAQVLRARYLVDVESFAKVQGQPIWATEIEQLIEERQ
jgi:2-oxoglutarate ferredoxin oxidoreductase subunit alpha